MAFSSSSVNVCFALALVLGLVGCRGGQDAAQSEATSVAPERSSQSGQGIPSSSTADGSAASSEVFSSQPFLSSGDGQSAGDPLSLDTGDATNNPATNLNSSNNPPSVGALPTGNRQSPPPAAPSGAANETPLNPPQVAALTAQQADAQINLRSQPTTQSSEQGYGLVGDPVKLLKSANGEGGFTWYYVEFESSGAQGWVRGDFVNTAGTTDPTISTTPAVPETGVSAAAGPEDSLGEALDAICGGPENLSAYYSTQNYNVYICNAPSGLTYVGNQKGTNETLVSQNVATTGTGFQARSGEYVYTVNESTLEVSLGNNADPLLQESVESSQRY